MIHSLIHRSKLKSSSIWKGEKIDFKDFYFPPSIPLRHYIEQTGTTANSGGVYTLTVADVEGKDRGTIPISITGPDKQEHVANIKIYVIGTSKYVKWYTYYILYIWYTYYTYIYIRCISRVVGWGNDWMQIAGSCSTCLLLCTLSSLLRRFAEGTCLYKIRISS